MLLQNLQDECPFSLFTPSVITFSHAGPRAKAFWDLAPGRAGVYDPENGFEDQARISHLPPHLKHILWQKHTNLLPLRIGKLRYTCQSNGRKRWWRALRPLGSHGVPHGSVWPRLDAPGGSATTTVEPCAVPLAPGVPESADAVRRHSAGRRTRLLHFFFLRVDLRAQDNQESMSQQRQGHEAIPGPKAAHFILIESHFSFSLLQTFFDLPATAGYPHQFSKRRGGWTGGAVVRPLARICQTAPDQNPSRPLARGLGLLWQLEPGPLIEPRSFASFSR